MKNTCWIILCLVIGFSAGAVRAAEEDADPVQLATQDAISNLIDEISLAPISRNVTIGNIVRLTNGRDDLSRAFMQSGEQIGGPRWLDTKTCQVRFQVPGNRIASAVQRLALSHLRELPVTLGELTRVLRDWEDRAFVATGTARMTRTVTGADPWQGVPKADVDATIMVAKRDAAQRTLNSVRSVDLTPRSTVADALAVREVGAGLIDWLIDRPVASTDYKPNLEAEVTLKVQPEETFETFRTLARRQDRVEVPADEQGWSKVRTDFVKRCETPVGRAMLPRQAMIEPPNFERRPMGIRAGWREPLWATKRLEASGQVLEDRNRSKLQLARVAEETAETELARKLRELPLPSGRTLGEAAQTNSRVATAMERALRHARIARTEYKPDGRTQVDIYLNLADLWDELRNSRDE